MPPVWSFFFLLYQKSSFPHSYSSSSTCHLQQHSQTSLDSYPPLPNFCKKTREQGYLTLHCFTLIILAKMKTTHNIRLLILEELLRICVQEDVIQKALKE